jgi:glyoxylase-like metal-dependent hydrolase (beta-lactamase superfamily II)
MRIHPLRLGRTKVPFGQFYGGTGSWKGIQAVAEFIADKEHFFWVPIHAYLVEHPRGRVLVDTGISPAQAQHRDYYRDSIFDYLLDEDEYDLPAGQTITEQLGRYGLSAEDVDTVVLTHLHEDHIGNLDAFPHARVLVGRTEYEARDARMLGAIPVVYEKSLASVRRWNPVDFTGPQMPGFDGSFDVFGDGKVVLVPTPGHSPGSTSVLVDFDDHRVLLTGDALYTLRHLAVDDVRAVQIGDESAYVESIRRVQWLRRLAPQVVVLPAHDHTEYGSRVVSALAADGRLSPQTRAWIEQHESGLFDPAYRLNPARAPRYVPAGQAGAAGDAA